MVTLFIPSGLFEIAVFGLAIIAFALAVRFFMDSRKRLQELFPDIIGPRKLMPFGFDRNGFVIPKTIDKKQESIHRPVDFSGAAPTNQTQKEIKDLRSQLQQQQQELTRALEKISHIADHSGSGEVHSAFSQEGQRKLEELRMQLEEKDTEINRLKAKELYSQKLQEHLEEVQHEYDMLQEKMQQMEEKTWHTAELTIQLERAEQSQQNLEKELNKKEERLREFSLENQHLQEALSELEGRLSEANLQRQQLVKKVQLLEELNVDMMHMAETNRKLKTEVGRIAELESLLNLMMERRRK